MKRNIELLILIVLLFHTSCYNKKNRIEISYFDNGDTAKVFKYKNDVLHGNFKTYYKNGNIKKIGRFNQGMKNGVFKEYFENGSIKEYRYYKDDSIRYSKRFNQKGQIIDGFIGFNVSNDTFKKVLHFGEPLKIGYSLPHSMVENPYLGLTIVRLNKNRRDTIVHINSTNNSINYNLRQYTLGTNVYELTILEVNRRDDIIIGEKVDTLSFIVLP